MSLTVQQQEPHEEGLRDQALIANEKLQYMLDYSKSSTIATILAPLLCVPLYWEDTEPIRFGAWLAAMTLAVITRYVLLRSIRTLPNPPQDGRVLNLAIGMGTLMWGLGWFVFVQPSDMVSYLLYQIISLTVLFVGMVGYCVNWKTFFAFVLPLKVPELIFITVNFSEVAHCAGLHGGCLFGFQDGIHFFQIMGKVICIALEKRCPHRAIDRRKKCLLGRQLGQVRVHRHRQP
jgi:hypothetical protein